MEISSSIIGDIMKKYESSLIKNEFLDFYPLYSLSTGESAYLTLFSRFYSLRNEIGEGTDLIIFIDEGEAGFHPQWQKRYIKDLVEVLGKVFPRNDVQLIIASNSPFIASDLPKSNIIFLEKEKDRLKNIGRSKVVEFFEQEETFASNIHTLYSNSFFMKDGLIGDFAKDKIVEITERLISKEKLSKQELIKIKKIIDIIGEPIWKMKLTEMWQSKMGN